MKNFSILLAILFLASCAKKESPIQKSDNGLELIALAEESSKQNKERLTTLIQNDDFRLMLEQNNEERAGSHPCEWNVNQNCTTVQEAGILTYAGCQFDFSYTVIACPSNQYYNIQDVSYTVIQSCALSNLLSDPNWATEANNLILAAFSSAMEDLFYSIYPNSVFGIILPKNCTAICGTSDFICGGEGGCCTRSTVPDGQGGYIRTVSSQTIECINTCLQLSTACAIDCVNIDAYLNGTSFSHTK